MDSESRNDEVGSSFDKLRTNGSKWNLAMTSGGYCPYNVPVLDLDIRNRKSINDGEILGNMFCIRFARLLCEQAALAS